MGPDPHGPVRQELRRLRDRAVELRQQPLPLAHKLSGYGSCLSEVGKVLALFPASKLPPAYWEFSRRLVRYIQSQVYWLMQQEEAAREKPRQVAPPASQKERPDPLTLEVAAELRQVDVEMEKAWKDFQG